MADEQADGAAGRGETDGRDGGAGGSGSSSTSGSSGDATTEAPTTEAPTSKAPTSGASTSGASSSGASSSEAPTTRAPAAEAPTTQAATTGSGSADASSEATTVTPRSDGATRRGGGAQPGPGEAPTQVMGRAGSPGPASDAPTMVQSRPEPGPSGPPPAPSGPPPRGASVAIGDAVRKILNTAGTVLRLLAYLCALVLVVFVVLRLATVNPENGVARAVQGLADTLVLDFRDLFLLPDPVVAVVVNYGLAALFWIVVGSLAARILRFLGRLVP